MLTYSQPSIKQSVGEEYFEIITSETDFSSHQIFDMHRRADICNKGNLAEPDE